MLSQLAQHPPAIRLRHHDVEHNDLRLGFHDRVLAHDARTGRWYATAAAVGPTGPGDLSARLDGLERVLDRAGGLEERRGPGAVALASREVATNMSRERYLRSVVTAATAASVSGVLAIRWRRHGGAGLPPTQAAAEVVTIGPGC